MKAIVVTDQASRQSGRTAPAITTRRDTSAGGSGKYLIRWQTSVRTTRKPLPLTLDTPGQHCPGSARMSQDTD